MKSNVQTAPSTSPIELTILLTCLIAATYAFGVYLFSALLPDMRTALGLGYAEIGRITGVAQVGFLAGAFFSSNLVQRLGGVRLILLSVLACNICLGLMPLVSSGLQIAILMVVSGCAAATVWVPMVAVVQSEIRLEHQGKVLGLISSGTAYGLFLNGFSVPTLLKLGGWKSVWTFSAALTLVLLCWGYLRLRANMAGESKPAEGHASSGGRIGLGIVIRDPVAVVVLLLMFFNGLACMPTMNYLLSFLREEIGYSAEEAGWVWSAIGFSGMFGGFAMGALADRITVSRALTLTYMLLGACTLLFLHHGLLWEVMLGAALFGLAFNAIFGLIPAFVSVWFDAQKVTAVFAVSNVMLGLGSMLGNLLGGILREQLKSFVPVYLGCFVVEILLIGFSIYLQTFQRSKPRMAIATP